MVSCLGPSAGRWWSAAASSTAGMVKVNRAPQPRPVALGPDAPPVGLDNPLADRQAQAGVASRVVVPPA